jgi:hypothetical protein
MVRRGLFAVSLFASLILITPTISPADPEGTPHCNPGWTFILEHAYPTRQVVAERQRVENRTRRASEATFTSTKAQTVSWSAKGEVGGGIDAIIFSVSSSLDSSVSKSSTATTGVSTTITVPRKSAVIGTYGVFTRKVSGTLEKGSRSSLCLRIKHPTVKLPAGYGWRTTDHHI